MERTTARTEPSTPSEREWAWFAGAVLVCSAMLVFRRPDAFTAPWFYAEEGRDFFAGAYQDGWASLLDRVNGYFHLYPRLVANIGISVGMQVEQVPYLNLFAVLGMYVVIWSYTFFRFPGNAAWRCIAVLCTVLPPLGNEVLMNMTNVQWPMALLIPMIFLGRGPSGPAWRIIDRSVLVLVCFTGPFALVFAPVVLLTWWKRHRTQGMNGSTILVGLAVLAALVQLVALCSYGSVERTEGDFDPLDRGFVQAVFYQLWYSVLSIGVLPVPLWAESLLTLGGIVLLGSVLRRTAAARAFAWCALSLVIVTLISYRGAPGFLSPFDSAIRNFYLPTVLLAWALACVAAGKGRRPTIIAGSVLCWWGVQTFVYIGPTNYPRPVPSLDHAALERGQAIEVPIDPPGWTMRLVPHGPSKEEN